MRDARIHERFAEGSPRVELLLPVTRAAVIDQISLLGYQYGYTLQEYDRGGIGLVKLVWVRDDSPQARAHVGTHLSGGTAHDVTMSRPGAGRQPIAAPSTPDAVPYGLYVKAHRAVLEYERHWNTFVVVAIGVVVSSLLCYAAWRGRGEYGGIAFGFWGLVVLGATAVTPVYRKRKHRRDLELVDRYRTQQARARGVPPPQPPPPVASTDPAPPPPASPPSGTAAPPPDQPPTTNPPPS